MRKICGKFQENKDIEGTFTKNTRKLFKISDKYDGCLKKIWFTLEKRTNEILGKLQ